MKQSYVILRQEEPTGFGFEEEEAKLEVECEELEPEAADRLRLQGDVQVVAPSVPLMLAPIVPISASAQSVGSSVESHLTSGGTAWGVEAVGATDSKYSGKGIKVAVLDTGIDPNHVTFGGVSVERRNFTDEDEDDTHGHGTHCAATIFGRDVNGVRIGVARGVEQALIAKVIGSRGAESKQVLQALQWAVGAGARVVCMALAFDYPAYVQRLQDEMGLLPGPAMARAFADYRETLRAFDTYGAFIQEYSGFDARQPLLVAAAGNESNRASAPVTELDAGAPSHCKGFVPVGALQRSSISSADGEELLGVASYSNVNVRLAAPGTGIVSAKARTSAELELRDGTSMAAAHVAGVAALFAEANAEHEQLLPLLIATTSTRRLVPDSRERDVGRGMVGAP